MTDEWNQAGAGSNAPWQLSYNLKPDELHSANIPEPVHRVGPPGVSSGVSLRDFPKTTLEEVARICQHFESKCGGQYSRVSPAARYVFEMSREVQGQLSALEAQFRDQDSKYSALSSTLAVSTKLPCLAEIQLCNSTCRRYYTRSKRMLFT
jgi:hypothetical protein